MVDDSETPAVSPEPVGGDERLGLRIAGSLLLLVGLGFGILANLYLHATAGATGTSFGPWTISSSLGPYAWATFGFGLFASAIGLGLWWISRGSPKGPIALPGARF
ncbi:MAG TPA: hypothetical protein VGS23_07410 [Thermoplasmata archaeon]|nr:hypothetical protein [Thermoplasmata archaeon]